MREELKKRIISKISSKYKEVLNIEDRVKIDIPKEEKFGDISTNIAFLLSKPLGKKPVEIANDIKNILKQESIFEKVDVAGAGFINIHLSTDFYVPFVKQAVYEDDSYGEEKEKNRGFINIEFVSANPTGPLHLGHGRGAVVGSTLANLKSYSGYNVEKEFYINDAGRQIYLLGKSVYARFRQIEEPDYPFPEDGYKGEYIKDIAKELYQYEREKILTMLDEDEAIEFCAEYAKNYLLDMIKKDLKDLGVEFDIWFSEKSLYEHGKVDEALGFLRKKGLVYEKEGALWLKTTKYGDDKDRVLIKSDGSYTYFAADIAYHYDKFKRGYDYVINVWGADHHGYFPRLKAAVLAFGVPDNWLRVIFIQMVKLFKNGKEVKMSKRSGEFITLRELLDEVGKDVVRYIFLTKDSDTHLNFDIDLALKQSNENPVYYVQYAHARIMSVFREAKKRFGFDPEKDFEADISLLKEDIEKQIMKEISFLPDFIKEIAEKEQPHKLTSLAYSIASKLHNYYYYHKFLIDDENLMKARLFLLKAVRSSLRTLFKIMGITPVEKM